jgi:hypothetical protein
MDCVIGKRAMCYEEEYIHSRGAEEVPRLLFPATSALSPVTKHNRLDTKVMYYGLRNRQEGIGYEEEYIVEASRNCQDSISSNQWPLTPY